VAMVDPTDIELLTRLEAAVGMTVSPLIAPESSIRTMIDRLYPEELQDEDTLSVKTRGEPTNVPTDPIFWDLIEELNSADLDKRLLKIEQSLDQVWTLLEKILRMLEARETIHRHNP